MTVIRLERNDDFEGWRDAARRLAAADIPAEAVIWQIGEERTDLFGQAMSLPEAGSSFHVPRGFVQLARSVLLHSNPERFSELYSLLLRVRTQPHLLQDRADRQVHRLSRLSRAIRVEQHKMHAFLRFREVGEGEARRFVAWFEPEHHILRSCAAFFVDRFTTMQWSILTPKGCLHWDGKTVQESPAASRQDVPDSDPVEAVWKDYYAATFNPARLRSRAMMKEMPRKYWHNMPETALIPTLIAGAHKRTCDMTDPDRKKT
ncbi:TIGR03915 family putative DNA repair protein [Gluconobacter morbifer]|uniref:Uracil-DNA glycosylase, 4 family protein n=1 Tax=Gluconobacter morbifer G707 TaxID=1088869 RepID=G6XHI3_9PROT|nr:TIGR03915 family putative DNA repair protein [Gluconobacter morbifer]EHH69641.1 uracil-DNA glycosylase, 4 family protein [Gluconobacter morbifer G707]